MEVTQNKKHFLQKVCTVIAYLCFVSAVMCMGVVLFYGDDLDKVYKASFAASTFFFFSVGVVLQVIGSTNLPKLSGHKRQD